MENEVWKKVAEKAPDAAAEAAEVSAEMQVPLATICRIIRAPRSAVYHRRSRADTPRRRPRPRTAVSDDELLARIRTTIGDSPFAGEGHLKVRARLCREHDLSVGNCGSSCSG